VYTAPLRTPHRNVHQTDVKRASGGPNPKRPAESYFTARYLLNFITCLATFVRCSVCITYLFNSVSKTGGRDARQVYCTYYAVYCFFFFFFLYNIKLPLKPPTNLCSNSVTIYRDNRNFASNERLLYVRFVLRAATVVVLSYIYSNVSL